MIKKAKLDQNKRFEETLRSIYHLSSLSRGVIHTEEDKDGELGVVLFEEGFISDKSDITELKVYKRSALARVGEMDNQVTIRVKEEYNTTGRRVETIETFEMNQDNIVKIDQ